MGYVSKGLQTKKELREGFLDLFEEQKSYFGIRSDREIEVISTLIYLCKIELEEENMEINERYESLVQDFQNIRKGLLEYLKKNPSIQLDPRNLESIINPSQH